MKKIFKKHFRKNRSKQSHGHPAYVYRKTGNEYIYLGLTHSPITKGKRNIRLKANPNPMDRRVSYVRPFVRSDHIKFFSKRLRRWKLSNKDKRRLLRIMRAK